MACWFALQFFANSSCTQAVPWNRPMQIQIDPDGHPSDPVCKKHSVTQLWDYQLRIGLTTYPGCTWKWFVYLGSRMCLLHIAVCWWPLQSPGAGRVPYPPKTVPDWGNIVKDTIQALFQVTFKPPNGNKMDFGGATRRSLRNTSPEIGIGFYISDSSHWVKQIVKRNYWFMAVSVSTNCFLHREMVLLILSMTKPVFGHKSNLRMYHGSYSSL